MTSKIDSGTAASSHIRRNGLPWPRAAIYPQITDVEGELNGFWTYDRQVAKMDPSQVRAINTEIIARTTAPRAMCRSRRRAPRA
jgi:hypothetical protein